MQWSVEAQAPRPSLYPSSKDWRATPQERESSYGRTLASFIWRGVVHDCRDNSTIIHSFCLHIGVCVGWGMISCIGVWMGVVHVCACWYGDLRLTSCVFFHHSALCILRQRLLLNLEQAISARPASSRESKSPSPSLGLWADCLVHSSSHVDPGESELSPCVCLDNSFITEPPPQPCVHPIQELCYFSAANEPLFFQSCNCWVSVLATDMQCVLSKVGAF